MDLRLVSCGETAAENLPTFQTFDARYKVPSFGKLTDKGVEHLQNLGKCLRKR